MGLLTCTGANMSCTMGLSPAVFSATTRPVTTAGVPAGNLSDHVPMLNIAPFGLCRSPSNPVVAAATAAASSPTPIPQSCIPATAAPWSPGSSAVLLASMPALNNSSTLTCLWGGTISLVDAGQVAVTVP
jgi:hypothetical protein